MYYLKEKRLAGIMADILGLTNTSRGRQLANWRVDDGLQRSQGDLSLVLYETVRAAEHCDQATMSLKELNTILDEIVECKVFKNGFTNFDAMIGVPIIQRLYSKLTSREVKWATRIVLKDLRLRIEPKVFFDSFHGWVWRIYSMQNNLKLACETVVEIIKRGYSSAGKLSDGEFQKVSREFFGIRLGTNIAIMACGRAQGIQHVVQRLSGHECFVEQKYDGERMQAHMCKSWPERIRIFSKSGRDSTKDRYRCHEQLLRALKFNDPQNTIESCIVEGELLVFNERTMEIENFGTVQDLQAHKCLYRGDIASGDLHYFVILFDLLYLNGQDLSFKPLEYRRALLETLVVTEPNHVELTKITRVHFGQEDGSQTLKDIYAEVLVQRMEGLIIKKASSAYIPGNRSEWLKLKKDYIEGFGDTAEFAVVGVAHNPDDQSRLTTLIIGCLTNKEELMKDDLVPSSFLMLFTVSQGLNKEESLLFNERIKVQGLIPFKEANTPSGHLFAPGFRCAMDFILERPIVAELLGSGFVKERGQRHHVLRFPRIRRIFFDHPITDTISFQELQDMAETSFTAGTLMERNELAGRLTSHADAQTEAGRRAPSAPRPKRLVLLEQEAEALGNKTQSKMIKALTMMETPDPLTLLRTSYFLHADSEVAQANDLVARLEASGYETLHHFIAVTECEIRDCIVIVPSEKAADKVRQVLQ